MVSHLVVGVVGVHMDGEVHSACIDLVCNHMIMYCFILDCHYLQGHNAEIYVMHNHSLFCLSLGLLSLVCFTTTNIHNETNKVNSQVLPILTKNPFNPYT